MDVTYVIVDSLRSPTMHERAKRVNTATDFSALVYLRRVDATTKGVLA